MRNIISTILLAVYSIVLGHNVVPHHHHFVNPEFYCQHEEVQHKGSCCHSSVSDHERDSHQHQHCDFNEKIILTKSGYFSILFLPASTVEIEFSNQREKVFYANYTVNSCSDPNLRHILLRGPPLVSWFIYFGTFPCFSFSMHSNWEFLYSEITDVLYMKSDTTAFRTTLSTYY